MEKGSSRFPGIPPHLLLLQFLTWGAELGGTGGVGVPAGCPEGCPDPCGRPFVVGRGLGVPPPCPKSAVSLNRDGVPAVCDATGWGDVECLAWVPRLGVTWGWRRDPDAARGGCGCVSGLAAIWLAGKGLEEPVGSSLGCAKLS